MLTAYHIQGLTPPQVEQKIVKFMLTHILSLHKQAVQANNDFQSGNYKAVGTEGGVITQQIFGNGIRNLKDDADTLQKLYNGLFNQVGLLNPQTVVSCYDTNSISLTVDTVGTLLQEVAGASFIQAAATLKNYYSQLPADVVTCLQNNGEFIQVIRKYNLASLTRTQILAKFTQFSVLHPQELVSLDTVAHNQFNQGAFAPAGQQIGVMTQRVIGTSSLLRDDPQSTLQQYLNGYFEFIGLDDPTTVVSTCFNDDTATLVNTLIANLVDELANNKILIAEKSALDFIKNCPPSLKACVFSNPEVVAAIKAYRLNNYTPPVVVAKAAAYALTHVAEFTAIMVEADDAIQTQDYASAGKIFGQVTQTIFPPTFPQRYFRTAF